MKKIILAFYVLLAIGFKAGAQEIFDMPGATETYVNGINDSGEICGNYIKNGTSFAFEINKWGDTINLVYPGSYDYFTATGISNNGMVTGLYGSSSNTTALQGFIFLPNPGRNAGGNYVTVTSGWGGTNTKMGGITNDTCFAGSYHVGGNDDGALQCGPAGFLNDLRCNNQGTVFPTYLFDVDINHNVAGYIIQGGYSQCAIYRGVSLGWDTFTIAGNNKSRIYGMNDNNYICGNFSNATRGFFAKKVAGSNVSGTTQIYIPGSTSIYPLDINNNNEIVGYFTNSTGIHGFIIAKYDIGFKPSVNGYSFVNDANGCWPSSYYSRWSYATDPYLNNGSPFPKRTATQIYPPQMHDSWVDMVKSLDESGIYQNTANGKVMKNVAFQKWKAGTSFSFQGACFGMSNTLAMIYDNVSWYTSMYPNCAAYQNRTAFNYPANDTVREAIMQMQAKDVYSSEYQGYENIHNNDNLYTTMQGLKQELRNSRGRAHKVLGIVIQHGSGGHAVFPYKLSPDKQGNGIDSIYIYDPNHPGADDLYIYTDLKLNNGLGNWYYSANGQDAEKGNSPDGKGLAVHMADSAALRVAHLMLTRTNSQAAVLRSNGFITAYYNDSSIVHMTDDNSNVAVMSVDSSVGTSLLSPHPHNGGIPGIETTELFSTSGITTVHKSTRAGYSSNFLAISDVDYFIECDRVSCSDTTDDYVFSTGTLNYINNTTCNVGLTYIVDREDSAYEYGYTISNLTVPPGNNVIVSRYGAHGMIIQNFGPATSYTLSTQFITDTVQSFVGSIPIGNNTQEIILPHDTTNSGVYVQVDNGMDGSNEDTIFVNQTVTALNQLNAPNIMAWPVPSGDQLYVSGPQGLVSYNIVDMLGRSYKTGELNFGSGGAQILDLTGLNAGVYIIRASGNAGKWNYMFIKE